MGCRQVAQDTVQWWTVVNMGMNMQVLYKMNFFSSRASEWEIRPLELAVGTA